MGFSVIMLGVLLAAGLVMASVVTYGVAKDSQTAPLKAKNIYAGIKTDQAQTALTIVNTCLSPAGGGDRYTKGQGTETLSGPYTLYLTVRNNGSIVLNATKATVLFNRSYSSTTYVTSGNVWTPLNNASMQVSNIYIATPDTPAPGPEIRLLVDAENGVSVIAPTAPTNFTGSTNSQNNSFQFYWNASYAAAGIAYYNLYDINSESNTGKCPPQPYVIQQITGDINNQVFNYSSLCPVNNGGNPVCNADWFYLTAVDNLGNEGIQSRTIKCNPSANNPCKWGG